MRDYGYENNAARAQGPSKPHDFIAVQAGLDSNRLGVASESRSLSAVIDRARKQAAVLSQNLESLEGRLGFVLVPSSTDAPPTPTGMGGAVAVNTRTSCAVDSIDDLIGQLCHLTVRVSDLVNRASI